MTIDQAKIEFEKGIETFKAELSKLRTGRANPNMIEDLKLDYYGTPTPIKQLAAITVPEPRQLLIQPWDKNALASMEKAIRESDLALNPTNEGDKLRITVPLLTEDRRKEMTKLVGKLAEEARVRIRNIREEVIKAVKRQEEAGEIPEDERFRVQERLQKIVDEYNGKVKGTAEGKEKEIMTV